MHMQYYLCYNKIQNETREQPSAKILAIYQVSSAEFVDSILVASLWEMYTLYVTGVYNVPTSIECCARCVEASGVVERFSEHTDDDFGERT